MARITLLLLLIFTVNAFAAISGIELQSGKPTEIKSGARGMVALFLSAKCPCSNSHINVVKELANQYKEFAFVAIHANADESIEQARSYFKAANLPFPAVQDAQGKLADELKASKTPHAFVISPDGKILYKGGVTSSHEGSTSGRQYLREALEDLQAARSLRNPIARTIGCAISRSH